MRKPKSASYFEKLNAKNHSKMEEELAPSEPVKAIDQIPEEEQLMGEEGFINVTQTVLGKNTEEAKIIKVKPFVTTPARVEIHAKRHQPLGPNEGNITVAITISVPCYKEEIISMYKQLDSLVDKIMSKKLEKMGINSD